MIDQEKQQNYLLLLVWSQSEDKLCQLTSLSRKCTDKSGSDGFLKSYAQQVRQ